MNSWWSSISGSRLAQGDLLPDCLLPVIHDMATSDGAEVKEVPVSRCRLIVLTQSCDLENNKAPIVALCVVHSLAEFEAVNSAFKNRSRWEEVRKGRIEGLHLLASPSNPQENSNALVVDFGHIVSLPVTYLARHAETLGGRWRLASPFLEHFSQAFARFFMRVGLPSGIAPFK